jgi:hypothetical protein
MIHVGMQETCVPNFPRPANHIEARCLGFPCASFRVGISHPPQKVRQTTQTHTCSPCSAPANLFDRRRGGTLVSRTQLPKQAFTAHHVGADGSQTLGVALPSTNLDHVDAIYAADPFPSFLFNGIPYNQSDLDLLHHLWTSQIEIQGIFISR